MMTISNAKSWHDKGFRGKGIKVMIAEPNVTDYHANSVKEIVRMYAPEAEIIMFKYNSWKDDELMEFALRHKPHIINTSYGVGYPKGTFIEDRARQSYKRILDSGIIVINSAGNEGINTIKGNGVIDSRIINVGMCTVDLKVPSESSYDLRGTVDCCGLVGHKLKDGTILWGTSESAPYVTGLLATAMSKEKMNLIQVNEFIKKHSLDILAQGRDNISGNGLFVLPKI
jgi:subtilisin family serine protease